MKGNARHPPAPAGSTSSNSAPLSPTAKSTAKYTNKDGSKFITVPKASTLIDSSQPSPTSPASNTNASHQSTPQPVLQEPLQPVNRKKQKRRAKAAAKAAADQGLGSEHLNGLPSPHGSHETHAAEAEADYSGDEEDQVYEESGGAQHSHPHSNGFVPGTPKSKKTKKKKKKNNAGSNPDEHLHSNHDHGHDHHDHHHRHVHSPARRPPHSPSDRHTDHQHRSGISREKIWNTSSQEERERIKEFWLGLSESERKSLVKVEKDAVLKKMKEQQKHTCSCTVCGRKRTAIEEELEGLYDAYYEELEQYANHPNQGEGPPMLRPRQSFGSMSGDRRQSLPSSYSNHQPSRGRIIEHVGDDDEEDVDDDYSEEDDLEEEDEYSDEEPSEELHRSDYATDFFNFGNSLTVQGGILTVADDLLKNDGKKFIEMMEQLAERRMAREEDAREQFERGYPHTNGEHLVERRHYPVPAPEEEEYEEEEDEDFDGEEEEEYDSQEEEDTMTEEQRMEEGRRMFQIFAARMFEQRVLTAYREKVAKERQAKLLEELEDETRQESQRKAKKAKEAQKRKDKAAKKREAQAEEKARREAEKAAEEAARLAEEAHRAEEQRIKAEEKRRKKEAQKKTEEEERKRKEAERQRRLHEREETERKAREAKEREKKAREEARLKEKEAREQKEREAREKKEQKEQQERDRRDKEARARAEREAKENKDKTKQEERAAQKAAALAAAIPVPMTLPKRPAPHATPAVLVPVLPQQPAIFVASPQIPVATPAFPKVPTPVRARQASQQEAPVISSGGTSQTGSAASQNPSPHSLTPVHSSPGTIGPPSKPVGTSIGTQPNLHLLSHSASPPVTMARPMPPQHNPFMAQPMGMPFPPGMGHMPPGFGNHLHREPVFPPMPGFRPAPGMMGLPPGLNGPVAGRGFPIHPPPGFPGPLDSPVPGMAHILGPGAPKDTGASHSRQGSGSFEPGTPSQPIGRPTPIGRPGSVVHGQRPQSGSPSRGLFKPDADTRLGSSALLDDLDEPLDLSNRQPRGPMGLSSSLPRPGAGFPVGPFGMDPMFLPPHTNPWGPAGVAQSNMFPQHPPPGFGHNNINVPWGPPGPMGSTFGVHGVSDRPFTEPRSVQVRKMLRRACEDITIERMSQSGDHQDPTEGFIPIEDIVDRVESLNVGNPVAVQELLDMCETEGNEVNGGGSFDVRGSASDKFIRFVSNNNGRSNSQPLYRAVGAPGEQLGSPIVGGGSFGR